MKLLLLPGFALVYAAMFQMPATPPIKMGLWESEVHLHMNMPNMPAMMQSMMNKTHHARTCMTPESYAKSIAAQQQQRKDCQFTNQVWAEKKYSFDMTCSNGKMLGHSEIMFDSDTAAHGTMHLDLGNGGTGDSTTDLKWVGADCGSVTPDKPEIIK